jgi:hypothetical protein
MRKILTYLAVATLALIGYTNAMPCSQKTVAQNCPTATHLCCANADGESGYCASLAEGCDGNGIFYGEYVASTDEPMWIGRKENYRPPRPQKDIENVFAKPSSEEQTEDAPMWIGRKENYRPPRPEEDIEEVFDRSNKNSEGEQKPGDGKKWKHGDRPRPPRFVRKVHRFIREHKQKVMIAGIILAALVFYRKFVMTPTVAPKEEEKKCTCTCGNRQ